MPRAYRICWFAFEKLRVNLDLFSSRFFVVLGDGFCVSVQRPGKAKTRSTANLTESEGVAHKKGVPYFRQRPDIGGVLC